MPLLSLLKDINAGITAAVTYRTRGGEGTQAPFQTLFLGSGSAYRAALGGEDANHAIMTRAISGRPARCLSNLFTRWSSEWPNQPPDYPVA